MSTGRRSWFGEGVFTVRYTCSQLILLVKKLQVPVWGRKAKVTIYIYMVVATPASVQEGGALDSGREVSFATSLDLRYISANAAAQLSS